MSIGLVIYFAYSYYHSRLGKSEGEFADEVPADYKPPIAALIAMILVMALTIWQVAHLNWIETAVRLFAWIVTGV
ncbi:hypothetical protein J0692_26120, partial [Vibrio alginolyticus]|nr:hypothetical protein [Vibrio alginolyticus]